MIVFLVPVLAMGQAKNEDPISANKAIYLEIAGSSMLYAVKYDKIFHQNGRFKVAYSVGIGVFPRKFERLYANVQLPLEITAMQGKGDGHFEYGIGVTPYLAHYGTYDLTRSEDQIFDYSGMALAVTGRLGYRYQIPDGGLLLRLSFNPIFALFRPRLDNLFLRPYVGASIGKSF